MTLEINKTNNSYKCSSCGEPLKPVFEDFSKQIDDGLFFQIYGGYGEFFDTVDGDNPLQVALCHDCSVKVMEIIDPNLTQKDGHPTINPDNTPCCKWCWLIPSEKILI